MRVSVSVPVPGSAAGRLMVKVVPWAGRLSTLRRPPIAAISERASKRPFRTPWFGRREGLEELVADEVGIHAQPLSDTRS